MLLFPLFPASWPLRAPILKRYCTLVEYFHILAQITQVHTAAKTSSHFDFLVAPLIEDTSRVFWLKSEKLPPGSEISFS